MTLDTYGGYLETEKGDCNIGYLWRIPGDREGGLLHWILMEDTWRQRKGIVTLDTYGGYLATEKGDCNIGYLWRIPGDTEGGL